MSNLRGNLQSISLTDVVQLLNVNRKTGKLYVINGKHTGTLYVLNGDVIHAETPQSVGESAAFEVLEWDKGEFEFAATKVKVHPSIRRTVPDLLMESARTADSRKRFRTIFPNLHAVPWPVLREPQLTQGLKLYPEDRKVLPFLDGYRDFTEVQAVSDMSEIAVFQTCMTLKESGRLQVFEPTITVSTVPLKSGFFRKANHVELSRTVESVWKMMGPYRTEPIRNIRIIWPEGPVVAPIQFVDGGNDQSLAVPKELMQAWNLPEGMYVSVRPAP